MNEQQQDEIARWDTMDERALLENLGRREMQVYLGELRERVTNHRANAREARQRARDLEVELQKALNQQWPNAAHIEAQEDDGAGEDLATLVKHWMGQADELQHRLAQAEHYTNGVLDALRIVFSGNQEK